MVKIRLRRLGAAKRPFYRVVVADSRSPRDGRFIEAIGRYQPMDEPSLVEIDADRALHWLAVGAQPTQQVRQLLKVVGVWERFEADRPKTAGKLAPISRAAPMTSAAQAAARSSCSSRAAPSRSASAPTISTSAEAEPPAEEAPVAEAPPQEVAAGDESPAGGEA